MKIVINTRLLRKNDMDGIGWFTYHTCKYLVQHNKDIEFHFLFDTKIDEEFLFGENVIPHVLFPPAKHAFLNVAFFQYSVPKLLKHIQPDLFLSPDGNLALNYTGKQYGIIHDISFFHFPQDLKKTNAWYYNRYFPQFAQLATRLGTVSEYSKQDIATNFSVDPNKIDVLYCGINDNFYSQDKDEAMLIRQQFAAGKAYFLFVGTLHPRKNIVRLIQAFNQFKKDTNLSHKLVIVGKTIFGADELKVAVATSPYANDIVFTGRQPDNIVSALYAAALALVFVPHFEGFGIPILEGMRSGIPVITSNTTSMPEIAGDAAIIVDPYKVNEIANAMSEIASNISLRESLIIKGKEKVNEFSWDRTSGLLWDSLQKII